MAKTTAPLLSFDAGGQIGKTQVYAKWKGVPYARRYVIPANPQSTAQTLTRDVFTYINGIWKFAGTNLRAPWTSYASGKKLTNRNAILSSNVKALRGQANNDAFVGSPSSNGGIVATSIATADAGGQTATVTLGVPSVPSGWTITDSIAVLIPQITDFTLTDYTTYEAASGDALGVVSVPAIAGTFVAVGWFKMTNANGKTAYGESLGTTVTLA